MDRNKYLKETLLEIGIELPEEAINQLIRYFDLLIEKNKVMNLTAITNFEEAAEKHFADSLALLRYKETFSIVRCKVPDSNFRGSLPDSIQKTAGGDSSIKKDASSFEIQSLFSVIDVGSGAGFPGIPLKIACPDWNITLLDSVNKKTEFQKEVTTELNLSRVNPIHMRSEDAAHDKKFRERYDLVTARAVANLSTLSEYCLPFLKIGGVFAAYKSDECDEEIKQALHAIELFGGKIEKIEKYAIGENKRALIFIRKKEKTPMKYPRKAGLPSKQPLV